MRIFLSILANGLILFAMQYFLPEIVATGGWKLYFVGGVILGLLNTFVKPILKIFGFPLIVVTLGLFSVVINGVILALLEKIIAVLNIAGVSFSTGSFVNFAISVVILTLFNTLYSVFFK